MFITNISKLEPEKKTCFYICDGHTSEQLIRNGFPLLSAIYSEEKFVFVKTDRLMEFLEKGGATA